MFILRFFLLKIILKYYTDSVQRRLVFETHVTVRRGNALLSSACQDARTHSVHNTIQTRPNDRRIHNSARKFALRSSRRRHPDANIFRRLQQRLRETWIVTPTAVVNVGRTRAARSAANKEAIIAAVERQLWKFMRWNYLEIWPSKHTLTINCINIITRRRHICFHIIILYVCLMT